jgi:hypothetical protein
MSNGSSSSKGDDGAHRIALIRRRASSARSPLSRPDAPLRSAYTASLVIFDREFATYALFHQLADEPRQRHWLCGAKNGRTALRRRVVQKLGPRDDPP